MGTHYLESYALYQSTSHHVNTDVNDNENLQYFESPRENNRSSSCLGDKITTTTTSNLSKIPSTRKEYLSFQTERENVQAAQCAKSKSKTKVMVTIFEIDPFEHKFVVIKVCCSLNIFKKYGSYWSRPIIKNSFLHEHRCLENIKKL